jgi:bifunctional oligoribonuclease and PAP phosphatase NrnA
MNYTDFWTQLLETKGTIYLTGHFGPDPDALCAISMMHYTLQKLGHKSIPVLSEGLGKAYDELEIPNRGEFIPISKVTEVNNDDVLLILDAHTINRCFNEDAIFITNFAGNKIFAIDHHTLDENSKIDMLLLEQNSASTTELLYSLITSENPEFKEDKIFAYLTQVGIYGDTDRFLYRGTPKTFEIMAACSKLSYINVERLYKSLLKIHPDAVMILAELLPKVVQNEDYSYLIVDNQTEEKYMDHKAALRSARAIFLQLISRQIEGIEWSFIARERKPGVYRVSFRSLADGRNVLPIAKAYGGGGVEQACSAEILADTQEELIEKIMKYID